MKYELDEKFKCGDRVYRVWPSGKKTLGILCKYTPGIGFDKKGDNPTHFLALETYTEEGGVIEGDVYAIGTQYKYIYEKEINFTLIPFTWEDREKLRGKWIKHINTNHIYEGMICYIDKDGVGLGDDEIIEYSRLLQYYTFVDGSPCGKYGENSNIIEDDEI